MTHLILNKRGLVITVLLAAIIPNTYTISIMLLYAFAYGLNE